MKLLFKILIIAIAFAGAMAALMVIKGSIVSGKKIHKMVFIENVDDWRKCRLSNAKLDEPLSSIRFNLGSQTAELAAFPIDPGFPFTRLILSWNSTKPDTLSALNFEVEVSSDGKDWKRFEYIMFGVLDSSIMAGLNLPPTEIASIGKVDIDDLNLTKPMRYARVVVRAYGAAESPDIFLRRLSLSFSAENSSWSDYAKSQNQTNPQTIGQIKLSVPYFSQRNLPAIMVNNCCSPTSVSMVLNYYGKNINPETFAVLAYDPHHQLYGNWPFNVEAAYLGGLKKTWVESHSGFDEIYDEIADGKPVIISVAYGLNELPNSPIGETSQGHLITVVGFDGPNIIICNDPAGHNVDDGIIRYPRRELESAWLTHGGVAYHLWPE
jgi:uncharacterized protein YvpB